MTAQIAVVNGRGEPEDGASAAIVPWWSFTKTLIAACALRLAEAGRLDLDRPLPGRPYTLRLLLQHRAGVADYGALPEYHAAVARGDDPWTVDEVLARVAPGRLLFPPGAGFSYSNVGYLLARRVIEEVQGAGLDQVLAEGILRPLGLPGSRLARTPDDMRRTVFAGGHGYHPGWVFHGTIVGPAVEAALALHRLLEGDLLGPASRSALLDAHPVGAPPPGRPWVDAGHGLGLMIGTMAPPGTSDPLHVAGHSAGGPGSVGAVYHAHVGGRSRTVAAFTDGSGSIAEDEALLRLAAP